MPYLYISLLLAKISRHSVQVILRESSFDSGSSESSDRAIIACTWFGIEAVTVWAFLLSCEDSFSDEEGEKRLLPWKKKDLFSGDGLSAKRIKLSAATL